MKSRAEDILSRQNTRKTQQRQLQHRRPQTDELSKLAIQGARISNERVKRYISDSEENGSEHLNHRPTRRRLNGGLHGRARPPQRSPGPQSSSESSASEESDYEAQLESPKPARDRSGKALDMRDEETADSEDSPDDEEYTDNEVVAEEEQDREDGDSEASVSTRSHRHSQPSSAASSSDSEAETSESDGTTTVAAGTTETAASAGPDDNEDSRPIGKRLRKRSNINYAADSSFIDVNNDSQEPASSSSSSDGEPTGITAKLGRTLRPRRPRVLHTDGESTATASPRSTSHSESAASTPGRTSRRRSDRPKAMTDGGRNEQLRLILELAEKCANSLAQQSQKQSPIKYNLRDRDKTKSYYIPMPQMSPSPSPSPQKNTQSGKVPAADVASTRASCRGRTPQPAASSAGENEAGRGEGQAAGNDELELILPMNLLELGPERCRRAGYVNDELFAGQTAAGAQHVSFEDIGGLDDYIESLKEMTVLPLLYPEIYSSFGIKPPRGVLFHGPPGTGKTLMARALAQSCVGQGGMEPIAFFMRRGADCLSKWVGEAERQLRHLFEQARAFQPSIIFFDELDGLAPVRSSRQDQVHASIVATLLSLMDGIDDRGQVVVIGATNRPDAIDAALRRPGRFDREMLFRLPNAPARERILRIHTRRWTTPLSDKMVADIVERTQGWGGADLSALCTEAALASVRRVAPRIYSSDSRVTVDVGAFSVQSRDVDEAMRRIVPSTRRSGRVGSQALPRTLEPLLGDLCRGAAHHLCQILEDPAPPCMPRMAVCGAAHMNVEAVGAAIAHAVESKEIPVFVISVQEMFGLTDGSPAQYITRVFAEAQRSQPSLVVIPMVNSLADIVDSRDIELLDACVSALKTQQRIGVLVSASCWMDPDGGRDKLWTSAMPGFARRWLVGCMPSASRVFVEPPSEHQLDEFFASLFDALVDCLPAPSASVSSMDTGASAGALAGAIEATIGELWAMPMFKHFIVTASKKQQEHYAKSAKSAKKPLSISTIQRKAARRKYQSTEEFLTDIELVGQNAVLYFEEHGVDVVYSATTRYHTPKEKEKSIRALRIFTKSLIPTAKAAVARHLANAGKGDMETQLGLPCPGDIGSDGCAARDRDIQAFLDFSRSDAGSNGLSSPITMPSTPMTGLFRLGGPPADMFSALTLPLSLAEKQLSDQQGRSLKEDPTQLVTPPDTEADDLDALGFGLGLEDMGFDRGCNLLRLEIHKAARSLPIEALEPLRAYLIAAAAKAIAEHQQQQSQQNQQLLRHMLPPPHGAFLSVLKALGVWKKEYVMSCV